MLLDFSTNLFLTLLCDMGDNPTLKNQWAKYLEDASYILLSFYSFPDWPSYEREAKGVRRGTSVVVSPCSR